MQSSEYCLFPSQLGVCALIWGQQGVVGLALPGRDRRAIRQRLRVQFGTPREASPSEDVQRVIERVQRLLDGEAVDLSSVELDMRTVPPFHQRVYVAARAVPFGTTVTYGEIAKRIASPHSSRAVGQALGRNPFAIIVPCHRVVSASGGLGGFTAHGGVNTKQRLLAIERPSLFD